MNLTRSRHEAADVRSTLVYGVAIAGEAVARVLVKRGERVVLADDIVSAKHHDLADELGVVLIDGADEVELDRQIRSVDRVVPAPGVPEGHRIIAESRALEVPLMSEIEVAYRIEQEREGGPRPMVGVTGTDGKTTTTLMAAAILNEAGHRSMAVGNTETPLIAALDSTTQVFAVECSSFRLAYTERFRTRASVWLNFAPDHLDWHHDLASYRNAKAKIWQYTRAGDVAVAPADDEGLLSIARDATARMVTFGSDRGDYNAINGNLTTPHGSIMSSAEMKRSLPHDVTNALAAAAICIEAGLAEPHHVAQALTTFEHAPHRIQLVAERDGVRWFDDSKATSPHAAQVAIKSFDSIVLIAGGKNKNLDLSSMASQPRRMRAVIAIGYSAPDIVRAFGGICTVETATSMSEAIRFAHRLSKPNDVVLLSPGCTSYDWYSNYNERGDDFARLVNAELGG
ncbi:MAG: UDP-N-acetylmuramoyl-L-alanine--D-glutamate ligase [Ilumatobacteraceae bacterium]